MNLQEKPEPGHQDARAESNTKLDFLSETLCLAVFVAVTTMPRNSRLICHSC